MCSGLSRAIERAPSAWVGKFLVLGWLLFAFSARGLITNNLAADWLGGAGINAPGGRVAQWTDQHQLLNNDGLGPFILSQPNATFQPYTVTDAHGYPGVMFPWAVPGSHPHTVLNLPSSFGGLDPANLTVYVVATGPFAQESQSLIWFTGQASGWIKFYQTGNFPANMLVGTQASSIYPPLNRAVFVGASDTNATTIRWNNLAQTNPPQAHVTTGNGGMVAANNGNEYFSGIVYRILIYESAHSAAQIDAQVAELARMYGVLTNYTKQVVCRGASTVHGQGSTMLQSYPFQLWERYPEILWHSQGLGNVTNNQSGEIGTNGLASSMYNLDGTYVDTLYDAKLQVNWLFIIAGINDIHTDGLNGAATYGRLTNYVAARKAARPWKLIVSTIQADVLEPATNISYNAFIRAAPGGWDALVDPGVNSPIETRLNNPYDTRYFTGDGVHLNNAGYAVLADHFGQTVNLPRRSTGHFGP